MARKLVKFTLEGPYAGKDFTPKFAPMFVFTKGVMEIELEDAKIREVAHLLTSYGATHEIVKEPKPKRPAKKKVDRKEAGSDLI